MHGEDPAHGHEAEGQKEHPVLRDLDGRDGEQGGQPEGDQRGGRDDIEVLDRDAHDRVLAWVAQEPGK